MSKPHSAQPAMSVAESAAARANLLSGQLRPNQVNNPAVLSRFGAVARENFTAPQSRFMAYAAAPVAQNAPGRELMVPQVLGRLLEALDINPSESVLVLAGGSGYSAALLAGLAGHVTLREDEPTLVAEARTNLKPFSNIKVIEADVTSLTVPTHPYDALLLDAPVPALPHGLYAQVREGGRIAALVQAAGGVLQAVLATRHGKTLLTESLIDTKGQLHPAFSQAPRFEF